jgi:hypothetical protein
MHKSSDELNHCGQKSSHGLHACAVQLDDRVYSGLCQSTGTEVSCPYMLDMSAVPAALQSTPSHMGHMVSPAANHAVYPGMELGPCYGVPCLPVSF